VSDQEARYDRIAEGYAAWWSPVHRPATLRLLDEIEADVRAGARRIVDVGCGTGALAAAAVERWPDVTVEGVDLSIEMLRIAARTRDALPPDLRARIRLHHAPADRLGLSDGSADIAVAAFVLQLVPSAYRALREARRVLRPGGRIACVTWLRSHEPFAGDEAFDAALEDEDLPPRGGGGGRDDPTTPGQVAARLRRAGFRDATARRALVAHPFTPEGFVAFLSSFDEEDLFASLPPDRQRRLETRLLGRLRALPPERMRMELPVAYATAWRRA
jgi:SAM-dependent methyltransferase